MVIGIDIRTLMDEYYSGVSEYVYNIVKEILATDKNNQYVLFYNSYKDVATKLPSFKGNYKLIGLRYPNKVFNYIMQKSLRYPKIDELLGVDLFFMPHINFISLSPTARSILTVHDLSFVKFPKFFSERKMAWHYLINTKKLTNKFTDVVAVSDNTKNDLVELFNISPEKIKVIYSGIDKVYTMLDSDNEKLTAIKNKYKLPEKFILTLGTIEPRKNIDGIIKAYDRFMNTNSLKHDIKLVIAGGDGWKNSNIYKIWNKSKFKNNIIFLGYIPGGEKVYLYNLATVFLYPSFYEGFGFPPLEAMKCGTPVISSTSSSMPEMLDDSALLVDPYNIEQMSICVNEVFQNKTLQNDLIKKGLKQSSKFDWQITAKKYVELFINN